MYMYMYVYIYICIQMNLPSCRQTEIPTLPPPSGTASSPTTPHPVIFFFRSCSLRSIKEGRSPLQYPPPHTPLSGIPDRF